MESSKVSVVFACLVLHGVLAQQPTYRQAESSQKVQLEDIEQDSLKNAQPAANQVQSAPQYTAQYPSQNSQLVYTVPSQQSQHVTPGQAATQPGASYPLFTIPSQANAGGLPGQQHFIYYMQPQQYTYDVPFFGGAYPFVPQPPQNVLQGNLNVNDLYKQLQQQSTTTSGKNTAAVKTATAAPQLPVNYYFSALPQAYYTPAHIPQVPVQNTPQYVAYNSFYPVQTAQKSVYSAGVKSTTVAPAKQTESSFRFADYNSSPDFSKVRVTG